jgi:hypothetical protein
LDESDQRLYIPGMTIAGVLGGIMAYDHVRGRRTSAETQPTLGEAVTVAGL